MAQDKPKKPPADTVGLKKRIQAAKDFASASDFAAAGAAARRDKAKGTFDKQFHDHERWLHETAASEGRRTARARQDSLEVARGKRPFKGKRK